jgi:hypothetical protein
MIDMLTHSISYNINIKLKVLKDEHKRLGRPLVGKTREQVVHMARELLQSKIASVKPSLVTDTHGTYITDPVKPSVYLPRSDLAYMIKLDGNGKPYVTDGQQYSKWVSDFFPDTMPQAEVSLIVIVIVIIIMVIIIIVV